MQQGGFRDLFTMGEDRHFHRTMLAYFSQVFQQISGINLITYYAATIYRNQIGLDGLTSRALAAGNGTGMASKTLFHCMNPDILLLSEYFLASWIAVFTIERFGRRQL